MLVRIALVGFLLGSFGSVAMRTSTARLIVHAQGCPNGCCAADGDCGICGPSCVAPAAGEAACSTSPCGNYCEAAPPMP
jgi:hypothetical protein